MTIAPKKHILFISYYFPPMGGGGVQRISKFLKYWDYNKYHVSVLTVKPSYFYAEDPSLQHDIPHSVSIYRTGTFDPFRLLFLIKKFFVNHPELNGTRSTFESGQFLRRLINFFLLPDSRILWLPFALYHINKINRLDPICLIIATMPPFTTGMIASQANRLWNIPFLLDFRDAWTNNLYIPRLSSSYQNVQKRFEFRTIKLAQGLIFVNPSLCSYYQVKYPFLRNKRTVVIRNGYDTDDFNEQVFHKSGEERNIFKIGIIGSVYSQGNAPLTLLKVISILKEKNTQLSHRLKLVFMGKWTQAFHREVSAMDIQSQVDFMPYHPHREALDIVKDMDALALALHSNLKGSELVTPGRIYEYLYAKKPILAMCPLNSDLAALVKNCDAGEVVDYHDLEGIMHILVSWLTKGTQKYSYKNIKPYNRKILTRQLLTFIDQVT